MILVSLFEELKPQILLGPDCGLKLFAVLRHVRGHLVDDRGQIRRRQLEDVGIRRRRRRRPSVNRVRDRWKKSSLLSLATYIKLDLPSANP